MYDVTRKLAMLRRQALRPEAANVACSDLDFVFAVSTVKRRQFLEEEITSKAAVRDVTVFSP